MTPFQQALLHGVLGALALAATVVLAVTNKISGADALAIVIAVSGISATGIAGSTTSATAQVTQTAAAKTSAASLPPPQTS